MAHPYPQVFFIPPPIESFPSKLPLHLCFNGDEENGVRTILSDPTMRVDAYCKMSVERSCRWLLSTLQKKYGGVEPSPVTIHYGDGLSTQVYVRNVDRRSPKRVEVSLAMYLCLEEEDTFIRMAPSDLILDQLALRHKCEEMKCAKVKITLESDPWIVDHSLDTDNVTDHRNTLLLIVKNEKMLKVVYDPAEKDIQDFQSLLLESGRVANKRAAKKKAAVSALKSSPNHIDSTTSAKEKIDSTEKEITDWESKAMEEKKSFQNKRRPHLAKQVIQVQEQRKSVNSSKREAEKDARKSSKRKATFTEEVDKEPNTNSINSAKEETNEGDAKDMDTTKKDNESSGLHSTFKKQNPSSSNTTTTTTTTTTCTPKVQNTPMEQIIMTPTPQSSISFRNSFGGRVKNVDSCPSNHSRGGGGTVRRRRRKLFGASTNKIGGAVAGCSPYETNDKETSVVANNNGSIMIETWKNPLVTTNTNRSVGAGCHDFEQAGVLDLEDSVMQTYTNAIIQEIEHGEDEFAFHSPSSQPDGILFY